MTESVFPQSLDAEAQSGAPIDDTAAKHACPGRSRDWASIELPDTWADQIRFRNPLHVARLLRSALSASRKPVVVPDSLPGRARIPKYVLQEFHGLPNGNYSKHITRGYITGFDKAMLGLMGKARQHMAQQLRHCRTVLDAGCGGGHTARAIAAAGVPEVWGLDPSPYLLQHAARDNPTVRFAQGVAEDTGFANQQFDGIAACFLFHEIPPRYARQALLEFNRILQPGGSLLICEPAASQMTAGYTALFRQFGFKGIYFGALARFVFEPFVLAWHATATPEFFAQCGFECVSDEDNMPIRHIALRKVRTVTA